MISKLDNGEEWLYNDGAHQTYTKFYERSHRLSSEMTKFESANSNGRVMRLKSLRSEKLSKSLGLDSTKSVRYASDVRARFERSEEKQLRMP